MPVVDVATGAATPHPGSSESPSPSQVAPVETTPVATAPLDCWGGIWIVWPVTSAEPEDRPFAAAS